jgi:hypothetical protein
MTNQSVTRFHCHRPTGRLDRTGSASQRLPQYVSRRLELVAQSPPPLLRLLGRWLRLLRRRRAIDTCHLRPAAASSKPRKPGEAAEVTGAASGAPPTPPPSAEGHGPAPCRRPASPTAPAPPRRGVVALLRARAPPLVRGEPARACAPPINIISGQGYLRSHRASPVTWIHKDAARTRCALRGLGAACRGRPPPSPPPAPRQS